MGQPNSGFLSAGVADISSTTKLVIAYDYKVVIDDIEEGRGGTYAVIVKEFKIRASSCLVTSDGRALNSEARNLAKHLLCLIKVVICGLFILLTHLVFL